MSLNRDEIIVDLRELELKGDILDMGSESKGVIYRTIKNRMPDDCCDETAVTVDASSHMKDYDWVYGTPSNLPFRDSTFDAVTVFFSLSSIGKKSVMNKTIREAARSLKKGGRIYIWDININRFFFGHKRKVKALLPHGETARLEVELKGFPGSFDLYTITPVVERYFIICGKQNLGKCFYIEAIKKDDEI